MRLRKFIKILGIKKEYDNIYLKGFTRHIDEVKEGYVFFSFKKLTINEYTSLKLKGAHFIVGESNLEKHDYLCVDDIKKAYQTFIYELNKHKLKGKTLIGVTGTNGKTSISTFLYEYLKKDAIYYGSNGIYSHKYYETKNTTPSMEEFFKYLGNEKFVIVELSSISFYEYRMFKLKFDYLILSNIYEDHLEYHETVSDYYYTKLLMLASNFEATCLISDKVKDKGVLRLNQNSYYYGVKSSIFKIRKDIDSFYLENDNKEYKLNILNRPIYQIENIMAAISLLYLLGHSLDKIISFYNRDIQVLGRLNRYKYLDKEIIIDYPHTASAYYNVLSNVIHKKEEALVIFGAGGDRQKGKREDYAKLVSSFAHFAIITNDNPRNEAENEIAKAIALHLTIDYEIILNRQEAIKRGLSLGYKQILILGKGAEKEIITNKGVINHSDIDCLLSIINA